MVMAPTYGNGKICYIEMPATDIAQSADFYKKVFGWQNRKRGDGSTAFDDSVGEVSGTWVLGRPPSAKPGLLFYIMVDSVAATIDAVVAHGGEIVQPIGADAREITARFRDPDGTPNLSPKGTTAVWDDDHIVFADIRSPATVSNLRRNPSTEINVVDPMVRKGYRFKGVASVLTEGALFERILDFYRAERNLDDSRIKIRSFVLVKIEEALPVVSPAYDLGLSEEQVREKMQRYFDSLPRNIPTTRREET